jgi:hypothetical protein
VRERAQTDEPTPLQHLPRLLLDRSPHVLTHIHTRTHTLCKVTPQTFSPFLFSDPFYPLAHGSSASRAETWSDAVSPLSPSLGTSSYDARHHHPQVRDLLPDLSATTHETQPIPRFLTPCLPQLPNRICHAAVLDLPLSIDAGCVARV